MLMDPHTSQHHAGLHHRAFDHNRKQTIVNVSSNIFILKMRDLQVFQIFIFVVGSLILSLSLTSSMSFPFSSSNFLSQRFSPNTNTDSQNTFENIQTCSTPQYYSSLQLIFSLSLFPLSFPFESLLSFSRSILFYISFWNLSLSIWTISFKNYLSISLLQFPLASFLLSYS